MLGFLPLKSYFETKKDPQSGSKKCPVEKEEFVRNLTQRDCLELLNCTYESKDVDVAHVDIDDDDIFN